MNARLAACEHRQLDDVAAWLFILFQEITFRDKCTELKREMKERDLSRFSVTVTLRHRVSGLGTSTLMFRKI